MEPAISNYLQLVQKDFSKQTGRSENYTKVTYLPSYSGSWLNNNYNIQTSNQKSSNLLYSIANSNLDQASKDAIYR